MATHIKYVLGEFLKKAKERTKYQQTLEEVLKKVLNEEERKHVKPVRIYKKHLVLKADSSSFTYGVNLKKETILKEIKKAFPEVEGIKIKTG